MSDIEAAGKTVPGMTDIEAAGKPERVSVGLVPKVRHRLADMWRAVPSPVRKTMVAVIGASLVLLGVALIVLPGPFTLPFLIAGFFVLGTEFAWAATMLARARRGLDQASAMGNKVVGKVTGGRVGGRPQP